MHSRCNDQFHKTCEFAARTHDQHRTLGDIAQHCNASSTQSHSPASGAIATTSAIDCLRSRLLGVKGGSTLPAAEAVGPNVSEMLGARAVNCLFFSAPFGVAAPAGAGRPRRSSLRAAYICQNTSMNNAGQQSAEDSDGRERDTASAQRSLRREGCIASNENLLLDYAF